MDNLYVAVCANDAETVFCGFLMKIVFGSFARPQTILKNLSSTSRAGCLVPGCKCVFVQGQSNDFLVLQSFRPLSPPASLYILRWKMTGEACIRDCKTSSSHFVRKNSTFTNQIGQEYQLVFISLSTHLSKRPSTRIYQQAMVRIPRCASLNSSRD